MDEVIKQYELHLLGKRRIRGGLLLETQEGEFTLTGYRENALRVSFDESVKAVLEEQGYSLVDMGMRNQNGEWLTKDSMGNFWQMKAWHAGKECNLKDEGEVYLAAGHLAKLHNILKMSKIDTEIPMAEKDTEKVLSRRSREMRRIYHYIRHKKKKNEMEIGILNLFSKFYEQAGEAQEELEKINVKKLLTDAVREGRIFHGSYNYHNILFGTQGIVTTNFEKCAYGLQVLDLYGFVRKFLEKNNFDTEKGLSVIRAYQKNRQLGEEEACLLYILLLFPEKFWKQMNFYYNGKKSWISVKNLDKMKRIEQQETARRKFLGEAKRVLIS